MLDMVFAHILDLSLQGSMAILGVLLLRLMLHKAPKVLSYGLWLVVLVRLLCPVSIQSPVSIVPDVESVADSYRFSGDPITVVDAGKAVYRAAEDALHGQLNAQQVYIDVPSQLGDSRLRAASLWDIAVMAGQYLWLAGVLVIILYSLLSYVRLRGRLIGAICVKKNIYLADNIASPFVLGLFVPKIYLPSSLESAERGYIITHEQYHIRRWDHVIKPIGFFVLILHWFNPLVWYGYAQFCKDMEMSCDEAVIRKIGADVRYDYSRSLLRLSAGKKSMGISPLAFGEADAKDRIKNLAKWRRPLLWMVILSVIVCLCASICMLTDPVPKADKPQADSAQAGVISSKDELGWTLCHAGYTAEAEFIAASCNALELAKSNERHLPVYILDTQEGLEAFEKTYADYLTLDKPYEEVPSFEGVSQRYDAHFFEKNKLVLVYIQSSDSSCRYHVQTVRSASNRLRVEVSRTKDSWANQPGLVGWFLSIEIPDSMLAVSAQVDAVLVDSTMQSAVPWILEYRRCLYDLRGRRWLGRIL